MAAICEAARVRFTAILFVDMQEILLGFDAREMWMTLASTLSPNSWETGISRACAILSTVAIEGTFSPRSTLER